jgi:hypothetical protein
MADPQQGIWMRIRPELEPTPLDILVSRYRKDPIRREGDDTYISVSEDAVRVTGVILPVKDEMSGGSSIVDLDEPSLARLQEFLDGHPDEYIAVCHEDQVVMVGQNRAQWRKHRIRIVP